MRIHFLSGSRCVGKSAIIIQESGTNVLLDYGAKLHPEPPEYPPNIELRLNGIIPSHAHLDHCGAIPFLYKGNQRCPLFSNDLNFEIMDLLLTDSAKINRLKKYPDRFSKNDIKRVRNHYRPIRYNQKFKIGSFLVNTTSAGHIPGSCITTVKGNKTVVFTGDVKLQDSLLLRGCELPRVKPDVLIIESTYADRKHANREHQEKRFVGRIQETLSNNGIALIPTFAVGRAQEVLLILEKFGIEYQVAIDGMAKKASEIILYYKRYIRDHKSLKRVLSRATWIFNEKQRERITSKPGVIVATAGMMGGGPIVRYVKELKNRDDCSILLVGYQVEDTPGRILFETNKYIIDEEEFDVRMRVDQFDFSSHAGRDELLEIIKRLAPKQVFCVHGDDTPKFAKSLRHLGFLAESPEEGEVFDV